MIGIPVGGTLPEYKSGLPVGGTLPEYKSGLPVETLYLNIRVGYQ